MGWATEGNKANPAADEILADTGPMQALSGIPITIVVSAKRACILVVAQRNALNTDDIDTQRLYIESGTEIFPFSSMTFSLNERLVVRCQNDADEEVQASILW